MVELDRHEPGLRFKRDVLAQKVPTVVRPGGNPKAQRVQREERKNQFPTLADPGDKQNYAEERGRCSGNAEVLDVGPEEGGREVLRTEFRGVSKRPNCRRRQENENRLGQRSVPMGPHRYDQQQHKQSGEGRKDSNGRPTQ